MHSPSHASDGPGEEYLDESGPGGPTNLAVSGGRVIPMIRRKRQRTNLACEGCKRRKSRCDVINGPICHRCEQLGVICSFESEVASEHPQIGSSVASNRQHLHHPQHHATIRPSAGARLQSDDVVSRLPLNSRSSMEQQLPLHTAQDAQCAPPPLPSPRMLDNTHAPELTAHHDSIGSSAAWPSPSSSVPHSGMSRKEPPRGNRDEIWYRAAADPEAYGLIHGGMGSMAEHGLLDPVAEGIVSAGLAETAYQVFKHQISGVLPYGPLLTTRSRLPSHPFLRSACLFYLTRCSLQSSLFDSDQIKQLELNVCLNLMAYHRGCRPSLESILAGLILSFLSYGQLEGAAVTSDFDPARMVGMAYGQLRELGHTVFIERVVDLLESGVEAEDMAETLQNARLHFCIMTRVSWTGVSRCPSNDLPTALNTVHHRFIAILRRKKLFTELDQHLMFEHASLDILMREARNLHKLERVTCPSSGELRSGNQATERAVKEMDALRLQAKREAEYLISLPWLLCQLSYSKWWITIRNLWFSYRIPTPLQCGAAYDEWLIGLSIAARASADLLAHCVDENWDLTSFPKAVGTAVVLCYHTLSMGIFHLQQQNPLAPLPPILGASTSDNLNSIKGYLEKSCPALRQMLRRTQSTLDEYKRQLHVTAMMNDNGGSALQGMAPLPFTFNVDMMGNAAASGGGFGYNLGGGSGGGGNGGAVHGGGASGSSGGLSRSGGAATDIAAGGGYRQTFEPSSIGSSLPRNGADQFSLGLGNGQGLGMGHWDPFAELAHGWNWQEAQTVPENFLDSLL